MTTAALKILEGDARATLPTLPERSIHMAVTSPPYWALRSYLSADSPLKHLELGSEKTPDEYIRNLVGVFADVRRALRDDGTLWVNIADTMASAPVGSFNGGGFKDGSAGRDLSGVETSGAIDKSKIGIKPGSRVCIPERFALAMQADGWLLRDVIIWHKLSPMPSSVDGWRWARHRVKVKNSKRAERGYGAAAYDTPMRAPGGPKKNLEGGSSSEWIDCEGCAKCKPNDGLMLSRGSWRTTNAHEYIFLFAKSMSYFADAEAVAEEAATATVERNQYSRIIDDHDEAYAVRHDHEFVGLTRNPRSVRNFKASQFTGSHYAAFPISIPEWCIRAGTSSRGVCAECGTPWARIVQTTSAGICGGSPGVPLEDRGVMADRQGSSHSDREGLTQSESKTLGWRATCACAADLIPATILDPFGGTGTSAEAAIKLGRRAVLCELNPAYVKLINERIAGSVPLFAACGEEVNTTGVPQLVSMKERI